MMHLKTALILLLAFCLIFTGAMTALAEGTDGAGMADTPPQEETQPAPPAETEAPPAEAATPAPTEAATPAPTTAPTEEATPTAQPPAPVEPGTASDEATQQPSQSPEDTSEPVDSVTPPAGTSPEDSVTPETSAAPEASLTPETSASPEASLTPDGSAAPEATPDESATPQTDAIGSDAPACSIDDQGVLTATGELTIQDIAQAIATAALEGNSVTAIIFAQTATISGEGQLDLPVRNEGTILGGSYSGDVFNFGGLGGGSFAGAVHNAGKISAGSFGGSVTNAATIEGGDFTVSAQSLLDNSGTLGGGRFDVTADGSLTNAAGATISGGAFRIAGTIDNAGTISGGSFAGSLNTDAALINNGAMTGGSFNCTVINNTGATIGKGSGGQLPGFGKDSELGNYGTISDGSFAGLVINGDPQNEPDATPEPGATPEPYEPREGRITGGTFSAESELRNNWTLKGIKSEGKVSGDYRSAFMDSEFKGDVDAPALDIQISRCRISGSLRVGARGKLSGCTVEGRLDASGEGVTISGCTVGGAMRAGAQAGVTDCGVGGDFSCGAGTVVTGCSFGGSISTGEGSSVTANTFGPNASVGDNRGRLEVYYHILGVNERQAASAGESVLNRLGSAGEDKRWGSFTQDNRELTWVTDADVFGIEEKTYVSFREVTAAPTGTPTPTPSPTPTLSPTPTATPGDTTTPSPTPTVKPTDTPRPSPTNTGYSWQDPLVNPNWAPVEEELGLDPGSEYEGGESGDAAGADIIFDGEGVAMDYELITIATAPPEATQDIDGEAAGAQSEANVSPDAEAAENESARIPGEADAQGELQPMLYVRAKGLGNESRTLIMTLAQLNKLHEEQQTEALLFRNGSITASLSLDELFGERMAKLMELMQTWSYNGADFAGYDLTQIDFDAMNMAPEFDEEELAEFSLELSIVPAKPVGYTVSAELCLGDEAKDIGPMLTDMGITLHIGAMSETVGVYYQNADEQRFLLESHEGSVPGITGRIEGYEISHAEDEYGEQTSSVTSLSRSVEEGEFDGLCALAADTGTYYVGILS